MSYSAVYTDQQMQQQLAAQTRYKNTSWLPPACAAFWTMQNIPWARRVMDVWGLPLPHPDDYESRFYFLKAGEYFKQFNYPFQATKENCAVLSSMKKAFADERLRIERDIASGKFEQRFINIHSNVFRRMENELNAAFGSLACDVYLTNQQQQQQVSILTTATDVALQSQDGSGTNYTRIAMIAIVLIVAFVIIKKMRNG